MFKLLKFQGKNLFIYTSIFLVLLLGFVFRFYNIDYENLWLDEIYSFWVTDPNLNFNETYSRIKTTESIPFLYYYLIKICNNFFSYDPIVGRIFSAFFGFLSIFIISNLCRKFTNNKSYLFAICLTSLNIYLIAYSQEMRVYIFNFFLISLTLVFFFDLYIEDKSKIFTKNFFLFSLSMFLSILSHPFSIIVFGSLICFIILDYFFFKTRNQKINISIIIVAILTLVFLVHYLGYVSTDKVNWIEQPDLKFFTNFYFSKFFGSRLLGIIHLSILIFLSIYLWKKIIQNKKIIFLYIMLFLSYFIPLIYGYFLEPIIFPKYIIFVLIPIILLISILIFFIENQNLKKFFVIFLILLNLGNHLTESTIKQFFNERVKFKPDFDTAFEMIGSSNTNKLIIYREKSDNQDQDFNDIVFNNYVEVILNNQNYKINFLKTKTLKNYKGKIWNICYIECFLPHSDLNVLKENFLNGGLKLSLWEIK